MTHRAYTILETKAQNAAPDQKMTGKKLFKKSFFAEKTLAFSLHQTGIDLQRNSLKYIAIAVP